MACMKRLYMKLENGEDLTNDERAFVQSTIADQEWDEFYNQFVIAENEKVGRIG